MRKISPAESYAVSIVRVCATGMILFCHIFGKWGFGALGNLLNVGVPLFFLISAFLYASKTVDAPAKWLGRSFLKLMVPIWLYLLIAFPCSQWISHRAVAWYLPLEYLLNLQGLWRKSVPVSFHLWFVTYMMLCYLAVPLLQKYRANARRALAVLLPVLVAVQAAMVLFLPYPYGALFGWTFLFAAAYYCFAQWNRKTTKAQYIRLTLAMLAGQLLRLGGKFLDDTWNTELTNRLYQGIVAEYSHIILAVWLFVTIFLCSVRWYDVLQRIQRPIRFLDGISYEIYIVHVFFISSVFALPAPSGIFSGALWAAGAIAVSVLAAWLLHQVSQKIWKGRNKA